MKDENIFIPIDEKIEDFHQHLLSHQRTILSAKYGDGKTVFLSHFMEDEKVANDFEFITIYPVNYQVLENRDIFDLIKFDILMQMSIKGMIPEDKDVISDKAALGYFIQSHYLSIGETFLTFLANLGLPSAQTKIILGSLAGMGYFYKLKIKFKEYKDKLNKNEDLIDAFMKDIKNSDIYDNDMITSIIRQGMENTKKNHHKQVVLVIEDMDRIDPAHLFRIMNVFTAEMDSGYHTSSDPLKKEEFDKFLFDRVIFVMDYKNTKHIFEHFYGKNTNFNGYIDKFCDKGYFEYSLKDTMHQYIYNKICNITGLYENTVKDVIPTEILTDESLRRIKNSIDKTDLQVKNVPELMFEGKKKKLNKDILILFIVMRRLNMSDEEIIRSLTEVLRNFNSELWRIFLPYFVYFLNPEGNDLLYVGKDSHNILTTLGINKINENGCAEISYLSQRDMNSKICDYSKAISKMLHCIAK